MVSPMSSTNGIDQASASPETSEPSGYLSAAEVHAIIGGVERRPEPERSAALAAIAREIRARQAAGTLVIDPSLQRTVDEAAGT